MAEKKKGVSTHLQPSPKGAFVAEAASKTADRMAEAAATFLGSLTREQQRQALYPAESEERLNWHYVPRDRNGIPLRNLDGSQRKLAHALISSSLSRSGYVRAMRIMALETILKELEGPARRFERDPDLYFITLFGTPSHEVPWGWRLEGHHISLNFLIVRGNQIAPTPNFFGANPARVPEGSRLAGLRILAAEEDLARQLLQSLDATQQAKTLIDTEAPGDIVTRAEARVRVDAPVGLPYSRMSGAQQQILRELLLVFVNRMPEDLAHVQMNRIEKEGKKYIHFAWAGASERGKPHYYRLHGPSFLTEYDNSQNNANHIHTVWRDLRNDWGDDLLRDHYSSSHGVRVADVRLTPRGKD